MLGSRVFGDEILDGSLGGWADDGGGNDADGFAAARDLRQLPDYRCVNRFPFGQGTFLHRAFVAFGVVKAQQRGLRTGAGTRRRDTGKRVGLDFDGAAFAGFHQYAVVFPVGVEICGGVVVGNRRFYLLRLVQVRNRFLDRGFAGGQSYGGHAKAHHFQKVAPGGRHHIRFRYGSAARCGCAFGKLAGGVFYKINVIAEFFETFPIYFVRTFHVQL